MPAGTYREKAKVLSLACHSALEDLVSQGPSCTCMYLSATLTRVPPHPCAFVTEVPPSRETSGHTHCVWEIPCLLSAPLLAISLGRGSHWQLWDSGGARQSTPQGICAATQGGHESVPSDGLLVFAEAHENNSDRALLSQGFPKPSEHSCHLSHYNTNLQRDTEVQEKARS